jgi:hypothetical protein
VDEFRRLSIFPLITLLGLRSFFHIKFHSAQAQTLD